MELQLTYDGAVAAAAGGAVLGAATMLKLAVNGNILGISGIVNGVCSNLVSKTSSPWFWRVVFASGFIAGGAVLREVRPGTLQALPATMTWARVLGAGVLVGFGTSMGNGCTSGHGISGLTRVSVRSIAATATFMATAAATASITKTSDYFTPVVTGSPVVDASDAITVSLVLLGVLGVFGALVSAAVGPSTASAAAKSPDHPARLATEFTVATTFALALGLSGMGRPQQVIAFLDLHKGVWDPTLAFVMGAALGLTVPLFHLRIKSMIPVLNTKLELPSRTDIDLNLLAGAALFGVGWGLCGVCPGPALINVFAPGPAIWESRNGAFIVAMLGGSLVEKLLAAKLAATSSPTSADAGEQATPTTSGEQAYTDLRAADGSADLNP